MRDIWFDGTGANEGAFGGGACECGWDEFAGDSKGGTDDPLRGEATRGGFAM